MSRDTLLKPGPGEVIIIDPIGGSKIASAKVNARQSRVVVTIAGDYVEPVPEPTPTVLTFTATGNDDTAALKAFVESHAGQRIALAGTIRVTSTRWTISAATRTTIDFATGAKLVAISDIKDASLLLYGCNRLTLNQPEVQGRGYGTYIAERQWQHGIGIFGGSDIVLNAPWCHDTIGDGIDIDVWANAQPTPSAIVINAPRMERNCRNGITGNAGQFTISGGTITQSGLHNIDMEPNGDYEAKSIDAVIRNVRLTRHGDMVVADPGGPAITGYAIAGLGYSSAQKRRIDIQGCSSDKFTISVDRADVGVFRGNASDVKIDCPNAPGTCADTAFIYGMGTLDLANNANMVINTTYDIAGPR